MLRIGMLTSGGDCQALNATMRGVVKGLSANVQELEVYGFYDGYKGLIYGNYRMLSAKDFSGILTKGGTILGSSRTPFKTITDPDENGLNKRERAILKYIEKEIIYKGYAPSVREICKAVGLNSTATVQGYLTVLEERGFIYADE